MHDDAWPAFSRRAFFPILLTRTRATPLWTMPFLWRVQLVGDAAASLIGYKPRWPLVVTLHHGYLAHALCPLAVQPQARHVEKIWPGGRRRRGGARGRRGRRAGGAHACARPRVAVGLVSCRKVRVFRDRCTGGTISGKCPQVPHTQYLSIIRMSEILFPAGNAHRCLILSIFRWFGRVSAGRSADFRPIIRKIVSFFGVRGPSSILREMNICFAGEPIRTRPVGS